MLFTGFVEDDPVMKAAVADVEALGGEVVKVSGSNYAAAVGAASHVVCPKGDVSKTASMLLALAQPAKRIATSGWLSDSRKKGAFIDLSHPGGEAAYAPAIAPGNSVAFLGGSLRKVLQARSEPGFAPVLSGHKVFLLPGLEGADNLARLAETAGASVLKRPPTDKELTEAAEASTRSDPHLLVIAPADKTTSLLQHSEVAARVVKAGLPVCNKDAIIFAVVSGEVNVHRPPKSQVLH